MAVNATSKLLSLTSRLKLKIEVAQLFVDVNENDFHVVLWLSEMQMFHT